MAGADKMTNALATLAAVSARYRRSASEKPGCPAIAAPACREVTELRLAHKRYRFFGVSEWVKNIPMGRADTVDDVTGLVALLASAGAAYITGRTVNVDGGLIMS